MDEREATPKDDRSGVDIPPPLYLLVPLGAGLLLEWAVPLPFVAGVWRFVLGGVFVAGGFGIEAWAFREMVRARTSPSVWEPTKAVVTSGPYRFSRNPIYVGFTMVYLGIAVLASALWPVLLLPPALAALYLRVVRREEAYLTRKFGDAYRAYRSRVRRWL